MKAKIKLEHQIGHKIKWSQSTFRDLEILREPYWCFTLLSSHERHQVKLNCEWGPFTLHLQTYLAKNKLRPGSSHVTATWYKSDGTHGQFLCLYGNRKSRNIFIAMCDIHFKGWDQSDVTQRPRHSSLSYCRVSGIKGPECTVLHHSHFQTAASLIACFNKHFSNWITMFRPLQLLLVTDNHSELCTVCDLTRHRVSFTRKTDGIIIIIFFFIIKPIFKSLKIWMDTNEPFTVQDKHKNWNYKFSFGNN